MKFDYIIGNPPYNREAQKTSTSDDPIYNDFMDETYKVSDKVMLITPARFLMKAGKTPKAWNRKMLNDEHLKIIDYYRESSEVFPTTSIPGGVVITYHDNKKAFTPIRHFIPDPVMQSIENKVSEINSDGSLVPLFYTQSKFNLDNLYKDYPEMMNRIGSQGKDKRFRQIIMKRFPELFQEKKKNEDDVRVFGKIDNKRVYRYIPKKYVEENGWLNNYKVFVPFSNGSIFGTKAEQIIGEPVIGLPGDGMTQTFLGVGSFTSKNEAENLLKYMKTRFARIMLSILKVTQGNKKETWEFVPLQDFSENSDIDWSQTIPEIDLQLYRKYGLDDKEIEFIENHVKEME